LPVLVLDLTKNPWDLALFLFLGWYVNDMCLVYNIIVNKSINFLSTDYQQG